MAIKIKTTTTKIKAPEQVQEVEQKQVAKPKAKPKAAQAKETKVEAVAVALTETQALVNELVYLDAHMKQLEVKEMMARHEEVKKRLQSIANDTCISDKEAVLEGTEGKVVFSARRTTTTVVDRDQMLEKLTPDVFMQVANVTMTELKKYLSEGEIMSFSGQSYGARTLKTVLEN